MEKRADGSMGTWCLRQTFILLFSFRFLSSHIHLSSAVTDFIWIADTVMKTDLNLLNTFKREFVVFLSVDPGGPCGIVVHMFLHDFNLMFPAFFLRVSGQCCSCKEVSRIQLSQRRRESISLTDGSRSKRRAEQTCLIKRKRWNDSLMHLLDAQLRSITWDF